MSCWPPLLDRPCPDSNRRETLATVDRELGATEQPVTSGRDLEGELDRLLSTELPHRAALRSGACRHAELLLAANTRLNLTRITAPDELAVKHVLDSLLPWRRWLELAPMPANARADLRSADRSEVRPVTIADLGSGGGYPGILLALLLPHARVVLIESIQKKAAFLIEAVRELALPNVEVQARRAEELLLERPVDLVTARAVDSARELLRLLRPAKGRFGRLVLYKGPGVELEIQQAAKDAAKLGLAGQITFRGELPNGAGERSLLEYAPLAS